MNISRLKFIIFLVLAFAIGFIISLISSKTASPQGDLPIKEIRAEGYKFISPLLRVDIPESNGDKNTITLKNKIESYISANNNLADNISVYFRNPSHYRRFTINQNEKYDPASVIKIVVMMAYFKQASFDPQLLNRKIIFDSKENSTSYNFPPKKDIVSGEAYTIDDLISYMIIGSSNEAKNLLVKSDQLSLINNVLEDLQLQPLKYQETQDFMDVYTYASFFRTLYNATYLSDEMSEKALSLLSETDFKDGLAAGLPKGIVIANKFGERNNLDDGVKQLHDCGIVYHPDNHYILCVMTRGSSFEDLEKILKNISAITYNEVKSWKGK
jgi:beta-lactamase class A